MNKLFCLRTRVLYRRKFLVNRIILLTLVLFWVSAVSAEKTKTISLGDAVATALSQHPSVKARQAQYEAAAQKPVQAGAFPEPRLILNAVNLPLDSFSLTQTPMTQLQMGITQNFPYPGKLSLKENIAIQESLVDKQTIALTSNLLEKQVKFSWWQLFYLDHYLETISTNLNLLNEFIDVAETKYTVGKGLQQEVLLAHVELAKLEDKQLQVEALRLKTQATFNTLLNQEIQTTIQLDRKKQTILPDIDALHNLIGKAEQSRPEIKSATLLISAAKGRLSLAEKDYYPDFKAGAIYGWRQDQTGLGSIQLSMNLPFNTENRQDRKIDQRRNEWLQQKYQYEDVENRITEEIHQALADYERSRKQTLIYKDQIIPQATQTVDSMLAGYQVNKVDFLNLLRAQINLFNFRTQYWQAFSSANQALAALEYAVGNDVVSEVVK